MHSLARRHSLKGVDGPSQAAAVCIDGTALEKRVLIENKATHQPPNKFVINVASFSNLQDLPRHWLVNTQLCEDLIHMMEKKTFWDHHQRGEKYLHDENGLLWDGLERLASNKYLVLAPCANRPGSNTKKPNYTGLQIIGDFTGRDERP